MGKTLHEKISRLGFNPRQVTANSPGQKADRYRLDGEEVLLIPAREVPRAISKPVPSDDTITYVIYTRSNHP